MKHMLKKYLRHLQFNISYIVFNLHFNNVRKCLHALADSKKKSIDQIIRQMQRYCHKKLRKSYSLNYTNYRCS